MVDPRYVKLVEELLEKNSPGHADPHVQMAWERGYLTGLLAILAKDDNFVAGTLVAKVKAKR